MRTTRSRRRATAALVSASLAFPIALAAAVSPAAAEPPPPIDLPAGYACDFDLRIDGFQPGTPREFLDRDGNVVRTILAGKGSALTFTNMNTGSSLSLRATGVRTSTAPNADGTTEVVTTGNQVLILFPTDVSEVPGLPVPSVTLIVGRVVHTQDASFNFVVHSVSGQRTDICAQLA